MPGMKWIEPIVFSKSSGNLVYRRTDGRTSGWIQYTPIPPSVERGYNETTLENMGNEMTQIHLELYNHSKNKVNLRDLIAATGLVIFLKLDLNRRFFSLCDLDIWRMTQKNNRAPLLCYFKLFASFRSHWWIQTGVTVRKRLIWVKIDAFFSHMTLKFDRWPSKTIGHLFYATSSFVHHFVAIGEFKLELQSGNAQSGSNATLFRAVWPWNLMDDLQQQ